MIKVFRVKTHQHARNVNICVQSYSNTVKSALHWWSLCKRLDILTYNYTHSQNGGKWMHFYFIFNKLFGAIRIELLF